MKFTLHKKPFFNDSKEHKKTFNKQPKKSALTTVLTTALTTALTAAMPEPQGNWVYVQSNFIDYKVFVPIGSTLIQTIQRNYPAIIKGWREEWNRACIDFKTSEDYEESVYDVFQNDKEEDQFANDYNDADDVSIDEDYEAAWDDYERQCYEWD